MTAGRPPIRPHPDHKPVVSGLGAGAARADYTEGFEFACKPCDFQNAIFGMEDGVGEILKASDEEEEAVKVASLPTALAANAQPIHRPQRYAFSV